MAFMGIELAPLRLYRLVRWREYNFRYRVAWFGTYVAKGEP